MNAVPSLRFRLWRESARVCAAATSIIVAGCLLGAAAAVAATKRPAVATGMAGGHLHAVRALRLYPISAANGGITAGALDRSWGIRIVPIGPVAVELIASQGNRAAPAAITLAMIPLSDILSGYYGGLEKCAQLAATLFGDVRTCEFNNIQHHAAVAQRRWSAADGMRALAGIMPSYGDYVSNLSVHARSSTLADVTYNDRLQGGSYKESGIMQVVYAPNPYLSQFESGAPEWVTLGFLSQCRAPAGRLASAMSTCRAILGSMQYSPAFKTSLVQRAMNEYASQVQTSATLIAQAIQNEAEKEAMVGQFSRTMASLQAERQQIIDKTNAIVNRGWWNVLGGLADVRDPTTGQVWNIQDNYRYYCRNSPSNRILGTNDGRDLLRPECGPQLHRISPGFPEPEP